MLHCHTLVQFGQNAYYPTVTSKLVITVVILAHFHFLLLTFSIPPPFFGKLDACAGGARTSLSGQPERRQGFHEPGHLRPSGLFRGFL
jgi:hypothetical protein